jgi:1,4-alpha-glucan branching enzyme
MLFMGEEFLEDRLWSDNPTRADRFIIWEAMTTNSARADFHAFTRDLIRLRRTQPALQRGSTHPYHCDSSNRVLAFHRWLPGKGRDVVGVISLSESTLSGYSLGFPVPGEWRELLNSDYYDHLPNPWVQGNNGRTAAQAPGMHGLPYSATITIPANSILVFSRA